MADTQHNPLLANAGAGDPVKAGSSSTLSWRNASFEVPGKAILKDISGSVEPGRLMCIMGPSGAGKSTMLNLLAGRLGGTGTVGGELRANNQVIDPRSFRSKIAYVMQEDALFATQTPREALEFSAALRLPKRIPKDDRTALVEDMLHQLGLMKCADTYIGSVMLRGVSGGEKKRTAIGVELISQPDILFLDEPTSGLDSYAAYNLVRLLGELAQCGVTIVCTVHQPSSEVFALFDDVMLLADGHLVYHASQSAMLSYFASHGFHCKANYNPADFVMFLMQQDPSGDESKDSLAAHARHLGQLWSDRDPLKMDLESPGTASPSIARRTTKESNYMNRLALLQGGDRSRSGSLVQLGWLAQREARNLVRNKAALYAQIGVTLFLNIIVGFVFKDAAKWPSDANMMAQAELGSKINNHFGALTQVAIGAMFGLSQPALLAFPLERPVFLREYATGVYSSWPYFFSKCMIEIPVAVTQSTLIIGCTYWLVGFNGDFVFLVLGCALLGVTAASTSLIVGSLVENVQTAVQATPLLFVPQLLFSGFFISITAIPSYMRWAQYLCSLKYGLNLLMIVEFDSIPEGELVRDAVFGGVGFNDHALFPKSDVYVDRKWMYVGILVAIFWTFRIASAVLLTVKAKRGV